MIELCLAPDAAAVTVNNSLNDRQTHAGAFEFGGPVQPLKDAEKFGRILHVETGAVVLDVINDFRIGIGRQALLAARQRSRLLATANLDTCRLLRLAACI